MSGILSNGTFWTAVGLLLAALGAEVSNTLWTHIMEAAAALAAIVGILATSAQGSGSSGGT